MSRIGKKPVQVPAGVKVQIADRTVTVEGKLGTLQWEHRPEVSVTYDEASKTLAVARRDDERQSRALHGLSRALLVNMIAGVTQGYEKKLQIVGTGGRVAGRVVGIIQCRDGISAGSGVDQVEDEASLLRQLQEAGHDLGLRPPIVPRGSGHAAAPTSN